MKNSKRFGCSTIALLVVFLCSGALLLPRIFDVNNDNAPVTNPDGNPPVASGSGNTNLGALVVTTGVDRDGCPVNDVTTLSRTDTFYVVAPNSEIAADTDIFARLYESNVAIEDVPIITSDRDYTNTCINFTFEHFDGDFPPGNYEVEFWVNGNAYDSITFRIE